METISNDNQNTRSQTAIKLRNPSIAGFLSILVPGLGQVYNGQLRKGIFIYSLILSVFLVFASTPLVTYFYGYLILIIIILACYIYNISDAVKNARNQKNYVLKKYNNRLYYILILIVCTTINSFTKSVLTSHIQTYKLPTTSNEPTLQVGDCIITDNKAYDKQQPGYGDIVVFKVNGTLEIRIYRVVGLPGDNLDINDDIVTINGKASKTTYITTDVTEGYVSEELEEELPNGHTHRLYRFKNNPNALKNNIKHITVPADSYYLLGDNRDNAADSRYLGSIDKREILGRATCTYFGASTDRINIDLRDK